MTAPGVTARQLSNARAIVTAALPFGREPAVAAVMTAIAESSLLRYANNGKTTRTDVPLKWRALAALSQDFPHDAVAGEAWTTADSIGMYQQRLMYGYSTPDRAGVAALMDIGESTRIFLRGSTFARTRAFMDSPTDLSLAQRCQWTQGSEYPTGENYAPHEGLARQIVAYFSTPDVPTVPTQPRTWLARLLHWS